MRQDDAKDGEISAAQKKANDFHGVSRERKREIGKRSFMLQEENVKKMSKMFLILESKVGESIFAIFFVVFSLKNVRKWTADTRIFAIVQKRKMHALLNETERKTRGIFTALVCVCGGGARTRPVARKQKGCPHSFGIQKSSQTTSVPDVLAAERFGDSPKVDPNNKRKCK